jgi:hypothetical protein
MVHRGYCNWRSGWSSNRAQRLMDQVLPPMTSNTSPKCLLLPLRKIAWVCRRRFCFGAAVVSEPACAVCQLRALEATSLGLPR